MIHIKNALVSVYDKENLLPLVQFLISEGVNIISSGGTAAYLKKQNIPVKEVSDITGFPEILEGRVKTLHPVIHSGILAKRTSNHLRQLSELNCDTIDLVVVNLYPFEKVKNENSEIERLIENIDIGGPTLLRAAAKNHRYVCVLPAIDDYEAFIDEYKTNKGITEGFAREMAVKTFCMVSYYDSLISGVLSLKYKYEFNKISENLPIALKRKATLRYGENPFQSGTLYVDGTLAENELSIVNSRQLWGKELSFNNYIDLDSALKMTLNFSEPFCAIIKHTNPCGAAIGSNIEDAFEKALSGDPKSAFGGIVGVNKEINTTLAEMLSKSFYECIIAPSYQEAALTILKTKKNIRLLQWPDGAVISGQDKWDLKKIGGGVLVQESDNKTEPVEEWILKTGIPGNNVKEMDFAWKMVKYVKSNAIVLVKNGQLIGVGAGQMSRVDSVQIAISKAKEFGFDLDGTILASDAFFPFADSIDAASKEGIQVFIEPGGSVRDDEVIDAARRLGVTLYFTGNRHFKH